MNVASLEKRCQQTRLCCTVSTESRKQSENSACIGYAIDRQCVESVSLRSRFVSVEEEDQGTDNLGRARTGGTLQVRGREEREKIRERRPCQARPRLLSGMNSKVISRTFISGRSRVHVPGRRTLVVFNTGVISPGLQSGSLPSGRDLSESVSTADIDSHCDE